MPSISRAIELLMQGGDPEKIARRLCESAGEVSSPTISSRKTTRIRVAERLSRNDLARRLAQAEGLIEELRRCLDLSKNENKALAGIVNKLQEQVSHARPAIGLGYTERAAFASRIESLERQIVRNAPSKVRAVVEQYTGPIRHIDVANLPG